MTDTTSGSMHEFDNLGILHTELPLDVFNNLKTAIDNLSTDAKLINNYLLGHMKEEYSLNHIKDSMSGSVLAVADAWLNYYPGYVKTFEEAAKNKDYKLYLDTLWVNKQKKYEFNPMHQHSGVLSFVIWVNIPYELEEEEKYFPPTTHEKNNNRSNACTSKFCFYYIDMLGKIRQKLIPVDKTYEGNIIMFPSSLSHGVYPFYTSDDYRISVSGNIRIGTAK